MLLVDDDDAGVGDRREDRRPGADDGARVAPPDPVPRLGRAPLRQRRVEERRAAAELALELAGEHGRQRDLRDEPDGAPAAPSASAIARRYTSVLPLPVTPWRSAG